MKYCSECGNGLLDEAVVCPKCGCPVPKGPGQSEAEKNDVIRAKKDLFTGLLLNIISFLIPVIMLLFLMVGSDGTSLADHFGVFSESDNSSSDIVIETDTDISESGLSFAVGGGFVIFLLGFAVYFLKQKHIKTILAYVYLVAAIADFFLFFLVWMTYIIITCGLGAIALIPGILQIRAGTKFIVGCRHYEA